MRCHRGSKNDPKNDLKNGEKFDENFSWKFRHAMRCHSWWHFFSSLSKSNFSELSLLLSAARASHTYVNTLSVCTNAQLCWERSTLSTGGAKLAPYGEGALRWRGCSPYAYGSRQIAELRCNINQEYLYAPWFILTSSFLNWDNFPGQPRCMWVYALPDSTRRLCLATKNFSPKKP